MRNPITLHANFPTDPDGFGKLIMTKVLAEAQQKTRSMQCLEHHEPATITIAGPGELLIVGCCDAFRISVNEALTR